MQLTLALSLPPTNHCAWGGCHSSTFSQGSIHSSSPAHARPERLGVARRAVVDAGIVDVGPLRATSSDGGNVRSSCRRASISATTETQTKHRWNLRSAYCATPGSCGITVGGWRRRVLLEDRHAEQTAEHAERDAEDDHHDRVDRPQRAARHHAPSCPASRAACPGCRRGCADIHSCCSGPMTIWIGIDRTDADDAADAGRRSGRPARLRRR